MQAAIIYRLRTERISDSVYRIDLLDKDGNVRHWYEAARPPQAGTVTMTYPAVERTVDEGVVKHVIDLLDVNGEMCHRSRGISREFAIIGLKEYGFAVTE